MKLLLSISILIVLGCGCTNNTYSAYSIESDSGTDSGDSDMGTRAKSNAFTTQLLSVRPLTLPGKLGLIKPAVQGLTVPGECTVQFDVIPPNDGNGFAAQAFITWVVNGQPINRLISVYSGASISGVCDSVNVQLQDTSGLYVAGTFPVQDPSYQITTTVATGTRATTMQPPVLYTPAQTLGAASTVTFDVPQDAGIISAMVLAASAIATATPADLQVLQTVGGVTVKASYYPLFGSPVFVPIVNGVTELVINNTSATAAYNVDVVFGVDG